ncbi:hypothetical protein VTK73DRAFT_7186 [Phialemonium thermophilum]|uniref:Cellobiose dehydrogenase-like cytochrome domain-containing protein n=1 Tax=Phialemonium thermophilum TaxID=223376 RepID=A0ABR3WGB4_9PEZI
MGRLSVLTAAAVLVVTGLLGVPLAQATPSDGVLAARQTADKYCDSATGLCYLELSTRSTNPTYRVAIPGAASAPFDTLLQIVAPASLGWAGFAWGGGMTLNPLTVAWPDGKGGVTVSSRWATGRALPTVYSGATLKTLSATTNATHWAVEVLCAGCSRWGSGASLSSTGVHTFAWAMSKTPVPQPANPSSSFSIHNNVGMVSGDMADAQVAQSVFQAHAAGGR